MCNIPLNDIQNAVERALNMLLRNDFELLVNNVNERSVSHKLAEYLQQEFPGWHVDCEYNRKMGDVKKLELNFDYVTDEDIEAKTVYPDIIVHHRQADENLLVIEMKKNGRDTCNDKKKLKAFTGDEYKYHWGLLLEFDSTNPFKTTWFFEGKDGEEE